MKYIAAVSTATAIKHKSTQSATDGHLLPGPHPDEAHHPDNMAEAEADTCENGPGVDSYGDGCEWYDDYPTDCGWYDTATWSSLDACCACKGQPAPDTTDMGPMGTGDICADLLDMFSMMFMMMDADGSGSISASEAMDFGFTAEDLHMNDDEEISKEELTLVVNEVLE